MEAPAKTSTRDAILDAADRLMGRLGFRKMTMDDIASEAGVGKRTIYTYFAGKEDVGLSSIGRVVEHAQGEIRAIADGQGPALDRLCRVLKVRVLSRVLAVQDYYYSLDELFEAVRPAYMERRQHYFDIERDLIAGLLEEGLRTGEVSACRPTDTAEVLLLATNAFLPYSLSVRELGRPDDIETKLTLMTNVLIEGLRPRKQSDHDLNPAPNPLPADDSGRHGRERRDEGPNHRKPLPGPAQQLRLSR